MSVVCPVFSRTANWADECYYYPFWLAVLLVNAASVEGQSCNVTMQVVTDVFLLIGDSLSLLSASDL